jgi:hypothetical protein
LVGGQNGPKKSVDENFGRNLSSFIISYIYRYRYIVVMYSVFLFFVSVKKESS